ncbi:hypothetical protein PoB_006301600 [Plakobranchus ocellatus]|uniref:Uncharacterized protein n=1 Tax=Plakobranchus ocellatus TaxID=259542 RepID=A0AAV4CXR5_9GAST|nr:hypothetical protein PoB_006301600 [Plakobranchus ocellatus]
MWRPLWRLQSVSGGRHVDSESFWGRVVLACYTGNMFTFKLKIFILIKIYPIHGETILHEIAPECNSTKLQARSFGVDRSKDIFDSTLGLENLEPIEIKLDVFVVKVTDPKANEKFKCGMNTTVMEGMHNFLKKRM